MQTFLNILTAVLFAAALVHTFSTKYFEALSRRDPVHSGLWHLLAEVEIVFGVWAAVLMACLFVFQGKGKAVAYLESRDFTEPMFVFAIMVAAGTRPVLTFARKCVRLAARALPLDENAAVYLLVLSLAPLLGSLITEPAAMTLAAMMLRDRYFLPKAGTTFKYATLGTLFVNVSIGGVLTPFAAPPVLMVAGTWGWDIPFMLANFGYKAVAAVAVNALAVTLIFKNQLAALPPRQAKDPAKAATAPPAPLIAANLAFLAGLVIFAHYPSVFMGLFLLFLGVAHAYERHMGRLILREGLLVACFLAGLVVLGGRQQWWLAPVLLGLSSDEVYYGAAGLTALTDNAALTYLGSLVEGLSPEFKYSLVAGAVAGGGLTIVANAPNPAGVAILRSRFEGGAVSPLHLAAAALPPTLVALAAFRLM